ncbi:PAS domain S-box protein [Mucilaginibacter aquariorum]|uniref:histidine kinase n=1 Tax=Mucilaginibacter aquariorum TaxID=2967225 RepID=A0ABT1T348_9SPHI|nr:PAS domain S-box protein [Mucilaginibacter aquariorum]MCQ6959042.1 PAS domain S-box protein [Mucilaginibacter aquariorum]
MDAGTTNAAEMTHLIANTKLPYELFDHLPIAIYTCDKDGYITSFNKAAVKLWGRTPETNKELWCGSWKIFKTNGQPLPLDTCPMARTLKEGIAIEGEEIIIQRPDGALVNVLPYPVPVFDTNGNITGAVNTLIDVTEQRSGERKQAMLASIITTSDDAIVSKTLEGIVTSWNYGAEQLFGYTESEAIGKSITMLIPKDRLMEEEEILSKIRKGEKVEHYKTLRMTKNGVEIPVSLAISPMMDSKGNIIGASKIARNVSKQQLAEQTLQQYAENLEILNTVGKVISEKLDVQEILQNVTDATTMLSGAAFGAFFYNKLDEEGESYMLYTLSGAPREAFEKFGMPRNTDVFSHTFNGLGIVRVDDITKDPRYGHNHPHYGMPKGHLPVVSYLAVPVISKSGEVIGGLFLGHPEPGRFTKEHEILISGVISQASVALDNAKLYEEIQILNSKKDEFIGLASHELKTPMTSLNGYLQIIDRSLPDDDKNKLFIQKALAQINKLSGLISDLLDVSKIEAGKLPFTYAVFNLPQLIDEVVDLMQYSTKSHRIIVCSDIDDLLVNADRQRIEQVVINLISNAIKYSPQADHINISVSQQDSKAIVAVQDFGIGINKEQHDRIFSRFYRVDDLAAHISGLGIGLYISNEIITRHQGKLSVDSETGKGSTFKFEIPIEQ